MENICFVIQPFKDSYDKRYKDVYSPAVKEANLIPIRVDLIPGSENIIEEIEKGIKNAVVCLADISADNPNVWFELGYAFAMKKGIVIICDEKSRDKLPFDITIRPVIFYSTDSISDLKALQTKITERINALKANTKIKPRSLVNNAIATEESRSLEPYEIATLEIIFGEQIIDSDSCSPTFLTKKMNDAGFSNVATNIALSVLQAKGFIEIIDNHDEYDNRNGTACRITPAGVNFITRVRDKHKLIMVHVMAQIQSGDLMKVA